jgi:hypothetical protein
MDGYTQPQNYSNQSFYSMHQRQDTIDHLSLNSTVARLVSEVQNLKDVTQNLLFSNNELQQSNDSLKARIQINEEAVEEILKTTRNRKKVGNRNVSNSHAALKVSMSIRLHHDQ